MKTLDCRRTEGFIVADEGLAEEFARGEDGDRALLRDRERSGQAWRERCRSAGVRPGRLLSFQVAVVEGAGFEPA